MHHLPVEFLKKHSVWHLLWLTTSFSVILSEIITVALGSWHGTLSPSLILITAIDSFSVSAVAAFIVIFLLDSLITSEKRAKDEVHRLNEELEGRVCERTAELDESERKYGLLIEQASDGIFITDTERNYISVNSKACEMLGYSREELLSMKIENLMEEDRIEPMLAGYKNVLGGRTVIRETSLRRKDNGIIPVEVSVKMIDGRNILAIVRDITERKKAEYVKERMQAQLVEVQKMEAIGRLAGGIAHDFNNLLTVIRGESSAAMADIDIRHPSHESIAQIYLSATRAAEMVRKLLVFSRQQPMQPVKLGLNKVVVELMALLKRIIGEDIAIETSLAQQLWTVEADRVSVEQVIMNLVINARDAMPGGGRLYIRTENRLLGEDECRDVPGSRPGRFAVIEVEDNCVGMDPETVKNLFNPFYSSKEVGMGTGLGLSVVHGIVGQHAGWITLDTKEGEGTKFSIFLEAVEGKPEVSAIQSMSLAGLAGNGERVLFVEDEEGIAKFAGKLLERNGYRVVPASDAEEALDIFVKAKGDFHLLLTDVVLPDQSGLDLIRELHRIKPGLPVLISSGYSNYRTQWPVIAEKGYRLIEKPYTAEGLLAAVKEAIINPVGA